MTWKGRSCTLIRRPGWEAPTLWPKFGHLWIVIPIHLPSFCRDIATWGRSNSVSRSMWGLLQMGDLQIIQLWQPWLSNWNTCGIAVVTWGSPMTLETFILFPILVIAKPAKMLKPRMRIPDVTSIDAHLKIETGNDGITTKCNASLWFFRKPIPG